MTCEDAQLCESHSQCVRENLSPPQLTNFLWETLHNAPGVQSNRITQMYCSLRWFTMTYAFLSLFVWLGTI